MPNVYVQRCSKQILAAQSEVLLLPHLNAPNIIDFACTNSLCPIHYNFAIDGKANSKGNPLTKGIHA